MIKLNSPGDEQIIKFNNTDEELTINTTIRSICLYIDNAKFILPPIDLKSLFLHMIESADMIDYYLKFYDRLYNNNSNLISQLTKKILSVVWCWHQNIRIRHDKITDELYAYSYIFSWLNICRIVYIDLKDLQYELDKKGEDFPFVQLISKSNKIIVSKKNINNYSLKKLWQSIILLWPCLYKFPYSNEMKRYFNILFLKYCNTITLLQNTFKENNFPKYYRVKQRVNTNVNKITVLDEYSTEIEYNNIELNIDQEKYLVSSLFFDAEIIFYHQLSRFSITKRLFMYYDTHKFTYYYKDRESNNKRLLKLIECFLQGIKSIITNQYLKNEIWEGLKNNLSNLFLMHGERERFIRENKFASTTTHSDDILNKIRSNGYKIMTEIKEQIPQDLINVYTNDIIDFVTKNEANCQNNLNFTNPLFHNYHSIQFKNEKEAIYLTFLSFEKWFTLLACKLNLKDLFLSEYFTPLDKFDEVLDSLTLNKYKKEIPILLNIMKHNFIIDYTQNPIKIYHSFIFIEAFMIWLILLIKYKFLDLEEWSKLLLAIGPFINLLVIK